MSLWSWFRRTTSPNGVCVAIDGTVCELRLDWPDAFKGARAGQFALLASLAPGAPILPRPLSLVPRMDGALAIAFNIKRAGTKMLLLHSRERPHRARSTLHRSRHNCIHRSDHEGRHSDHPQHWPY